jgi:PST family polysaccharide transporter
VARNADYLLIGRFLGAQELGYYTLAYRILLFPIQNISAVVGRVMYPVLSTMQNDNDRFSSAYLRVVGGVAFISFPLMTGVFFLAKPFVLTLFGEEWEPVILLIMILAPVGLIQSIGATVGAIYQAKGRTDWMFRWGIGSGMITLAAFISGLPWGVTGVATAYAISSFILFYPGFLIPFRLINLKFIRLLMAVKPALLGSGLMLAVLVIAGAWVPYLLPNSPVAILLLIAIIGVAVYTAFSWTANRDQLMEFLVLAGLKRENPHESR